jgi:hypothetical protein
MLDLYIYYKVREANAVRLEPAVRAMQFALAARTGVAPQLKRRPQMQDGLQTWMEVYPSTGEGFAAELALAEQAAGLDGLIEGPRRTELFANLTPCA